MKQKNYLENIKKFFKSKTVFTNLILVNIIVFAFIQILHVLFAIFLYKDGLIVIPRGDGTQEKFLKLTWHYLASSSDMSDFMTRPWSLITYMFTHEGFMHILGNMLLFYFFGRYLDRFLGARKLLSTYILGGIAGWVLYAVGYNFIPMFLEKGHGPMWGASAAVMATVVGAATYSPNMKINIFAFKIEFKYLAAIMVIIDFVSLKSGVNAGGHLGHLGGAIYGFVMVRQLQKGRNINRWMENLIDRISNFGRKKPKMKVVYNKSKAAVQSDEDYNYTKAQAQQKIDKILDKISHGGYDSLTKAEKAFLNKYSAK